MHTKQGFESVRQRPELKHINTGRKRKQPRFSQ